MLIVAVDPYRDCPDTQPDGIALWADDGAHWYETWDGWRNATAEYAERGYVLCAYSAEEAVTHLLYKRGEHVRVDYRDDRYLSAHWYYDAEHEPMAVWDVRPLCASMSRADLARAVKLAPLETPQRYTWQYRRRWQLPCIEHRQPSCVACWGVIERAHWKCADHDRAECDRCWKLQHARAIYEYMKQYAALAEGYGLKPVRTVGGMSHTLWRHIERPEPCALPSRTMDYFARAAYRAGRTEPFKLGDCGPVTYGDIGQMYGTVLRDIELPTANSTVWVDKPDLSMLSESALGIWDATVTVPAMYCPPLGLIHEEHFVFPVGTFRGHWTGQELRYAMRCGVHIDALHRGLRGWDMVRPFYGYIDGLMQWREQLQRSGDVREVTLKGLINALYGMIGMRAWQHSEYVMPLPAGDTLSDWPYHDARVQADHVLLRRADTRYRRGRYSNPMWAAMITATARIKLHEYMVMHGDDLVYCDTDSIITMGELHGVGTDAGELHYQGFYDRSYILAPKMYRLEAHTGETRTAHAGIPAWQMDRLIKDGTAERGEMTGLLGSYWTGLDAGRWVHVPVSGEYDRGKRLPVTPRELWRDGGWTDTRPIHLPAYSTNML